jgi:hypothetical protein
MTDELGSGALHGLFLPENEGDEPVHGVTKITVRRLTPYPGNAGRMYDALTELREPEDLRRLFGGGTYEVWGRDSNGYAVKGARRKIMLDGQAIPMDRLDDPFRAMPQGPPQRAPGQVDIERVATLAPVPAAPTQSPELDQLRRMVETLGQAVNQLAVNVAAQQRTSPQDGLLATMVQGQAELNKTLLLALTQRTGDPAQTHEVFAKGMETAAALFEPMLEKMNSAAAADDGFGDIAATMKTFFDGVAVFRGEKAPGASGPSE